MGLTDDERADELIEKKNEEIERLKKALEYFTNLTWQEAVEVFEEEE